MSELRIEKRQTPVLTSSYLKEGMTKKDAKKVSKEIQANCRENGMSKKQAKQAGKDLLTFFNYADSNYKSGNKDGKMSLEEILAAQKLEYSHLQSEYDMAKAENKGGEELGLMGTRLNTAGEELAATRESIKEKSLQRDAEKLERLAEAQMDNE